MEAPTYQAPPPDPTVEALKKTADQDNIRALQDTAKIDTSSIMARFGTQFAMSGMSSGSPLLPRVA